MSEYIYIYIYISVGGGWWYSTLNLRNNMSEYILYVRILRQKKGQNICQLVSLNE